MSWRERYRSMPRRLSGHAKKQLITRATGLSITEQGELIDAILHKAKLTKVKIQNGTRTYFFQYNGWTGVGKPGKKIMHIMTVFPTVH